MHLTAVMCLLVAGCQIRPLGSGAPPLSQGAFSQPVPVAEAVVDAPIADGESSDNSGVSESHKIWTPLTMTTSRHAIEPEIATDRPGILRVGYDSPEVSDDGHVWVTSEWSLANPHTDDLGLGEPQEETSILGWSPAGFPDESRELSFRSDLHELGHVIWDDTKSIVTWKNALVLGGGAGLAVWLHDDVDHEVREFVNEHPLRWGVGSKILRLPGEPQLQVPVLAGVYAYSLYRQDPKFHNFTKATISSFSIASLTSVAIKGVTNTRRPSDEFLDGRWGFPSAHVASCFAISATIDEYYGWPSALPAYVVSGLVGWSRIDQREHDLSDVVFGSIMGFVVGHSVARAHLSRDSQFQIEPWIDPLQRGSGVQMVIPY